jgi:glycosyltransferase involved in cell wall biosynthesis
VPRDSTCSRMSQKVQGEPPVPTLIRVAESATGAAIRVGVICDYLEEKWPSMDVVGDMICAHLPEADGNIVRPVQLRANWRPRLDRSQGKPGWAKNADRLFNRFWDYPSYLRGMLAQFDVFHIVDHSYSQLLHTLPSKRTVVTCHDLDTFRCVLDPKRDKKPLWFRLLTKRILEGFSKAAHILAVSETTRTELLKYGIAVEEQVTVVPNGVHPSCTPSPEASADTEIIRLLPPERDAPILLLNVASNVPRKRLDVLLGVFAAIREACPEAVLVRVGGSFSEAQEQLARQLGVRSRIVTLPYLTADLLAAMYRRATLLLQTSEAEGFGLPLIEALACGCPVVASDIPVMHEVGADAVTFCGVANIAEWTTSVHRLLTERHSSAFAWAARRQRGLERASQFNWAENARETVRIYQKVLAQEAGS